MTAAQFVADLYAALASGQGLGEAVSMGRKQLAAQPLRALGMLFMISNEAGAQTTLHCASSPALAAESGGYYARSQLALPTAAGRDPALAAELWRRSEAWLA